MLHMGEIARRTHEQQEDTNFQLSLTQIYLAHSALHQRNTTAIYEDICALQQKYINIMRKSVNAKERERA